MIPKRAEPLVGPLPALSRPGPARAVPPRLPASSSHKGRSTPRAVPRSLPGVGRNPTRRRRPRPANGIPPDGCPSGTRWGEDRAMWEGGDRFLRSQSTGAEISNERVGCQIDVFTSLCDYPSQTSLLSTPPSVDKGAMPCALSSIFCYRTRYCPYRTILHSYLLVSSYYNYLYYNY